MTFIVQARGKTVNAWILANGDPQKQRLDALKLLERAVQLDPKFAIAYCAIAAVHDYFFLLFDPSAERRALGDEAIRTALRLQPDLPEAHLGYANHLFRGYRDYERARAELSLAKRGLPNSPEVLYLEASIDRRQGQFEKAVQGYKLAIQCDPRDPQPIFDSAEILSYTWQFSAAERVWDQLIELLPDQPIIRVQKQSSNTIQRTADDTAYRAVLDSLPTSMADDRLILCGRLNVAIDHRDWLQAIQILQKLKHGDDTAQFAYGGRPVPIGCYSILIGQLKGEKATGTDASFTETRQLLNQRVETSPDDAPAKPLLLSDLAVVDSLLGRKEDAFAEGIRAAEMVPISKEAVHGARVAMNLAVVYAWTHEWDLAFRLLDDDDLAETPYGLFFNDLKLSHYFEPLREDPRYDRLLTELAPQN
jgi:tetratricopeptide (TPR) repeat protein